MMINRARLYCRECLVAVIAILGVATFVTVSAVLHKPGFPLDDSWIHQTYARNLAGRGEWAFVPGQTSVASTSPLYTALLAVGYFLGIPFLAWTFALGALALAAAGWICLRLAQTLFPDVPGVSLWSALAMVLAWHLVWAAASGMETMLFCTLTLAVIGLAWRELAASQCLPSLQDCFKRGVWVGLVGAALTLTRPEGAGLVALAVGVVALAQPHGAGRGGMQMVLAWCTGVVVGWGIGAGPYLAFNYHISGSLLPNTSAAKQAENTPALALPLLERYGRLLLPLVAGGQLMLIPGIGVALADLLRRLGKDRRVILLLLPLAWIVLDVSAYALRLPAPYQHGRYVIPVLPSILL